MFECLVIIIFLFTIFFLSWILISEAASATMQTRPVRPSGVMYGGFRSLGNLASQDCNDNILCICCESLLRIIAEAVIFHCNMTNTYCGDSRRRRICASTA